MRTHAVVIIVTGGILSAVLLAGSLAQAQRPDGGSRNADADDLVTRMMAFDENHDGKLTKNEITDERLHRLFDRTDVNRDGTVTKEELTILAAREPSSDGGGGPRGGGPGGGPPRGGRGGPMMGFRPGEVLPQMLQQRLNLSADQKTQLDALQKEVDARLEKILSVDQKQQLKDMRNRGPGAPGGPGGGRRPPGGPGGGPPPDGEPPPR
jgi:hypothetical protein